MSIPMSARRRGRRPPRRSRRPPRRKEKGQEDDVDPPEDALAAAEETMQAAGEGVRAAGEGMRAASVAMRAADQAARDGKERARAVREKHASPLERFPVLHAVVTFVESKLAKLIAALSALEWILVWIGREHHNQIAHDIARLTGGSLPSRCPLRRGFASTWPG